MAIQREFPADYRIITSKLPLPERKADDCSRKAVATPIICGREDAA